MELMFFFHPPVESGKRRYGAHASGSVTRFAGLGPTSFYTRMTRHYRTNAIHIQTIAPVFTLVNNTGGVGNKRPVYTVRAFLRSSGVGVVDAQTSVVPLTADGNGLDIY